MRIDTKQVARVLVDYAEDKSQEEITLAIKDVIDFLKENGQLGEWRKLEQAIHAVWKEKYGASQVTITSAHELNADAAQMLQKIIKGADVVEQIDEELIGGAVVRIDDQRIDGSIAGALKQLKLSLSN